MARGVRMDDVTGRRVSLRWATDGHAGGWEEPDMTGSGAVLGCILAVAATLAAYVRLAPSDPSRWHVDPLTAPVPKGNGWLLRDGDGSAPAPFLAADPVTVLDALDRIAMSTPRTRRLAGSAQDGRITWITRTRLLGFPDYTTAAVTSADGGTRLVILARQRFGLGDQGVNRARVEDWTGKLGLFPA